MILLISSILFYLFIYKLNCKLPLFAPKYILHIFALMHTSIELFWLQTYRKRHSNINLKAFTLTQLMQIVNQIGHLQHWGLTPAAHLLKHYPFQKHNPNTLKIFISGTSDIRHLLKTLSDLNQNPPSHKPSIQIYLHQTNKQLLCRDLLLLHLIHQTQLNFEERIELFLDLYGNAMIKQRNSRYVHQLREDLLNFIHDQKKVVTPLKKLVSLKLLKFEERDELSEIIQSWSMKVPLDMEKLRDNKLRYLYKERYDYRNNLVDWDYNMLLLQCAPIVHFYHYRQWRMTGLAFQQRFSKYTQPNRTLASYAPGRKKEERTSCLVRGYWGDIIVSPYIALGTKCDYHQSELLFKKANMKNIGHSVEVAEYNLNYWLHRLQKQQKYTKVFRDYYRADEQTKKQLEKKNEAKKKKKEMQGELGEIKQEQEKEINQAEENQIREPEQTNKPKKQKSKEQELDSDEEKQKIRVDSINSKELNYEFKEKQLLSGFTNFNISVHLMAMNSDKLIIPKYHQFFDVVCLGFAHSAYLTKQGDRLVKKGGLLLVEKASYLIPKKKQQRKQLNTKLRGLIEGKQLFEQVADDSQLFVYTKK